MKTPLLVCGLIFVLAAPAAAQQPRQQPGYPPSFPNARAETYQTQGDTKLQLFVFEPADHKPSQSRPAIVFFFGGGFTSGSPSQFLRHCEYLASRGMVAITADYRVKNRHKTTPGDSVEDGKAAMRYVRANAKRLGIDPQRIAAGGGSAGGFIAACVGVIPDATDLVAGRNAAAAAVISYTPNAMVLFNPAIMGKAPIDRTDPDGTPSFKRAIMPYHHLHRGVPPSILFYGEQDRFLVGAQEFQKAADNLGARCEVRSWPGVGHGFFNFGRNNNKEFVATVKAADQFLVSLGYLEGEPTIDAFMKQLGQQQQQQRRGQPAARQRNATQQQRQRANQQARQRELTAFMAELDQDRTGTLDKTELSESLWQHLAPLDVDEDEQLSHSELQKMRGRPSRTGEIITGAAPGERYSDTLEVGDAAPDFTLPDSAGKRQVTLSSFQGKKPVVLIFGSYT